MRATRRSARRAAAAEEPISEANVQTPARPEDKEPKSQDQDTTAPTVTPPDAAVVAAAATKETRAPSKPAESSSSSSGKHVRFGTREEPDDEEQNEQDEKKDSEVAALNEGTSSSSPSKSQRGLVSRRGRYVSPGRRQAPTATSPMSKDGNEEKSFQSPSRKHQDVEVPSLCSTNSGQLTGVVDAKEETAAARTKSTMPAASISCDPSTIEHASPLASHGTEEGKGKTALEKGNEKSTNDGSKSRDEEASNNKTTTTSENPAKGDNNNPKAPKSDAAKAASSVGIFRSAQAQPSTPSRRAVTGSSSFEEKKRDPDDMDRKPSPKRERERDHYVTTPTDFALDYGKSNQVSSSFDTSNVLAWLQSPTANGLFSPGGYGSIMNTPRGAPRTPRTPTVSTSFFFSDAASLPRANDNMTPPRGDGAKRSKNSDSNIICISPLSSKVRNGTSTAATPLRDVFASPKERNGRNMPLMADTPSRARPQVPQRSGSKDPSLDAAMAERDLMEDEDLSVLLQLASNTPRSAERGGAAAAAGTHVFRSPNKRKSGDAEGDSNSMPALQLPMIGGRDGDAAASRLARKPDSHPDADDFAPPQLGMRSGSSSGSKEIYVGGSKAGSMSSKGTDKTDGNKKGTPVRNAGSKGTSSNPYLMPPPYPPHHGHDYYPPMPPGMSHGPGGSMRVSIGGPPPPPRKPADGTPPRIARHPGAPPVGGSPHAPPPHYHGDPYSHYPPPPGMYGQYGPSHGGFGGYPPYQGHYPPPPPRHMGMYGAQHLQDTDANKSKSKTGKTGGKRSGSPLLESKGAVGSQKKAKKSTPGTKKIKNKSPQITDKLERQKAAAAIQAVNAASGGKNDKAAALAAAILRGVTMRPSGKWQAQLYFAGKSRYIGVFDTREKAALAYEIAREQLKSGSQDGSLSPKTTENLVNAARKAAFEGVNEKIKK